MEDTTRRHVLRTAAGGLAVWLAGCTTQPPADDPSDRTTMTGTPTPTSNSTVSPTDETPARYSFSRAVNTPDPDHPVYVWNDSNTPRTIRVRVVREATGETVYEETREFDAGADVTVYNTKQADPEGIETFRVIAELLDVDTATLTESPPTRDSVTIETNRCYGSVIIAVRESGELNVLYSIC